MSDIIAMIAGGTTMGMRTRLAALTCSAIMLCGWSHAQTPAERAERDLFLAVNQARHAQGLPSLRWDEPLAAAARHHAAVMAEHGTASHGFDGEPSLSARVKQAGGHFGWLSENVTLGTSAEFIHSQFMNSPNHRANVLDRDMDSVGVGVVERAGQFFAVEDFSQAK